MEHRKTTHLKVLGGFILGYEAYDFFLRFLIYFIFRQWGREGERDRNISVWLPLACPPLGTWSATQACALTGNQTNDPLVCRPVLNPLSHTSQGRVYGLFMGVSLECELSDLFESLCPGCEVRS